MPVVPSIKRAVAFIDGQNLFHAAKNAFSRTFPDYDVGALAKAVCDTNGYQLTAVRFYTGVHKIGKNSHWHHFWNNKLRAMVGDGIETFSTPLVYRNEVIPGTNDSILIAEEKGIDVRLALDIVRLARFNSYDVVIVFSQDQDLCPAVHDVKMIAKDQNRWIKVVSAYPSRANSNSKGIWDTDWFRINSQMYLQCLDQRYHRTS